MTKNKKFKQAIRAKAKAADVTYQAMLETVTPSNRRTVGGPPLVSGSFMTVVDKTIDLARAWRDDQQREDDVEGRRGKERLDADFENPHRLAFLAHLESQNDAALYKLVAIMYCGKGTERFISVYDRVHKAFREREKVIDQLMKADGLFDWLSAGLAKVKTQRVDLDAARVTTLGPAEQLEVLRSTQRSSRQLTKTIVGSSLVTNARIEELARMVVEADEALNAEYDRIAGRMERGEALDSFDAQVDEANARFHEALRQLQAAQTEALNNARAEADLKSTPNKRFMN